jgi:hypothetical protein
LQQKLPLVFLFLLGLPAAAMADTAPVAHTAPDAAFPLAVAYRSIGAAEAFGASGAYLDSARSHYRAALARYGKSDMSGAAAEARASSDLARAAIASQPFPVPKDLPAPPKPQVALTNGRPAGGGPQRPHSGPGDDRAGPPPNGGPDGEGPGGPPPPGGPGGRGDIDAAQLGALVKLENTAEARSLAEAALSADAAAQKAALAGNLEDALRQRMLAQSLAGAVRSIAAADHPELVRESTRGARRGQAPQPHNAG